LNSSELDKAFFGQYNNNVYSSHTRLELISFTAFCLFAHPEVFT